MRIKQTSQRSKKKVLIILLPLVLLLAGGTVFALVHPDSPVSLNKRPVEDRPQNTVDLDKPTTQQQEAGNKAKEEYVRDAYDTNDEPTTPAPAVSISFSSQTQNNGAIQLRTIIEGQPSSGTCTLVLTMSGQSSVTLSVATQSMGGYQTCQGFDVPTANLALGEWNAKVTYKDSAGRESSAERKVTVQ